MSHTTSQGKSRFGDNIRKFLKLEASGGLILMAAMVLAMIVKNSPLSPAYQSLLMLEGEVRLGSLSIAKPLLLWVNDFWMAILIRACCSVMSLIPWLAGPVAAAQRHSLRVVRQDSALPDQRWLRSPPFCRESVGR